VEQTYFVRERSIPLATATSTFGLVLVVAGFAARCRRSARDRLSERARGAQFSVSGWTLFGSIAFTIRPCLSPTPAIFWPSSRALFLLFINIGP